MTRAEVEEHTFAIKRELAAVKQHDLVNKANYHSMQYRSNNDNEQNFIIMVFS